MARRLAIVLALLFGGAAAVLLASDVSTSVDGRAVDCATVINAAAVDSAYAHAGDQRACHGALVHRTETAAAALLGLLIAGTATAGMAEVEPTSSRHGRRVVPSSPV